MHVVVCLFVCLLLLRADWHVRKFPRFWASLSRFLTRVCCLFVVGGGVVVASRLVCEKVSKTFGLIELSRFLMCVCCRCCCEQVGGTGW